MRDVCLLQTIGLLYGRYVLEPTPGHKNFSHELDRAVRPLTVLKGVLISWEPCRIEYLIFFFCDRCKLYKKNDKNPILIILYSHNLIQKDVILDFCSCIKKESSGLRQICRYCFLPVIVTSQYQHIQLCDLVMN